MTGALPATSSLHRIQQGRAATATQVLASISADIHAAGQLLLDCLGLHWRQLCSRAVLKGAKQERRARGTTTVSRSDVCLLNVRGQAAAVCTAFRCGASCVPKQGEDISAAPLAIRSLLASCGQNPLPQGS